jgi:hypothetical protein
MVAELLPSENCNRILPLYPAGNLVNGVLDAKVLVLGAALWQRPQRYLSGAGRLIIKDAIMLGAAVVTLADSAGTWLASSRRLRRNAFIDGDPLWPH